MNTAKLLAAALCVGLAAPAPARAVNVIAPAYLCAEWTQMRGDGDRSGVLYLGVFVTGVIDGVALYSGVNLLEGWSADAVYGWVDGYCAGHPDQSIVQAAQDLLVRLIDMRRGEAARTGRSVH